MSLAFALPDRLIDQIDQRTAEEFHRVHPPEEAQETPPRKNSFWSRRK